ncbi:hypothetical protein WJX73_005412 [Symbiochloris irregularis]|uniref:UspA domain-containing protein n=1 Tax=Symbiochloris irregularis TaxID=706552 RepID=A0AAW1NPD2_9CHLO
MEEPSQAQSHLIARRYDASDLSVPNLRDEQSTRHIVLALDSSETAEHLLQWAIVNLHRKGDTFHIVHVALVLAAPEEIQHSVPGMSHTVHNRPVEDAKADAERAKVFVREKFVAPLQAAHIAFEPHLFMENDKAPPESIAAAVDSVAKDVNATMIVIARSNKSSVQKFFVGSVAAKVTALPWPMVVVP